jgi:RNA polymerase subunit RPABC4/transcription elongation factor Spt4
MSLNCDGCGLAVADDVTLTCPFCEAIAERDHWRGLCESVDAHYSGSLDHQPHYVRAIRLALDAYNARQA